MFFIPETILTGKEYDYYTFQNNWLIANPHFVAKDEKGIFRELGINDNIEILIKSPHKQAYKYLNLKDIKTLYVKDVGYRNNLIFNREPNHFFEQYFDSRNSQRYYIDLAFLEKDGKDFISPVFVIQKDKLLPKISTNFDKTNYKLLNFLKKVKDKYKNIDNIIYYMENYSSKHSFKRLKSNPNQLLLEIDRYYLLLNTNLAEAVVELQKSDIEDYFPEDSLIHTLLYSQEITPDSIKNNIVGIDTYNNMKKYTISKNRYMLDDNLPQHTRPITDYDNIFLYYREYSVQFSNFLYTEISSWHTREGLLEIYNNMHSIFIKNHNRSLKTEKYFFPSLGYVTLFFRCEKDENGYKLKCIAEPFRNTKNINAEFYYTPKNKNIKYNDNPNFKLDIKYQYNYLEHFANIQNNPNNKLLIDNWQELKDEPERVNIAKNQEYLNWKGFKDIEIYQYLNTEGTIGVFYTNTDTINNILYSSYKNISNAEYTTNKLIDSRFDFFNEILQNTHIYIVDTNICKSIGFEKDYWRFMPLQALWFEVNDLYLYTQDGAIDKFSPKYIDDNGNFIYDLYLFDKFKFKWYMKCKEVLWDTKLDTKQDFRILGNEKNIKVSYCESKRDMYQTIYELFKLAVIRLDNIRLDLEIQ